ncbi:NAD(P)/FAD-dependent oxidoreductase [Desulfococcaceae bacterium HSG8]|nr:NAD(P)/FAD-dependent oxidoreductase [Desulfococcaceae bacterium HSG8]
MPVNIPEKYDLCVIGCGPGGFAGAMRALDFGKHVCMIEGGEIGGAGVMWGALTSKTMWELAKDYAVAAKTDRGYRAAGLVVDYQAVRDTVIQAAKEKQYQMVSQIETFSPRRWHGPGSLTFKRGWGSFISQDKAEIRYADGQQEEISASNFLIATGSEPRNFPNIETDQERVLSSDGVLHLEKFPKRLMIIGAGIIGCEYAAIFSNFGQTRVYLIDHMDRVVPYEDEDVSDFVSTSLSENGVKIIHSAILRDIIRRPGHLEVILDFAAGHSEVVEVDAALISIGRQPDFSSLNLEKTGIQCNTRGCLETDINCCVKDNIYAAGDVTNHPALVNMAEMEGRHAVEHMFGKIRQPLNYTNMSTIMFFRPAVAAVGLNEKNCQEKKIPYRVGYYSNLLLPRPIAMRSLNGFVKIIVTDDEEQKILGMRAAGPQVSSTIMSVAHFMDMDKGIRDVLKSVYPHPTISEGIQECLRLLIGQSVYKPFAFPDHLKIKIWHPEKGYTDVSCELMADSCVMRET